MLVTMAWRALAGSGARAAVLRRRVLAELENEDLDVLVLADRIGAGFEGPSVDAFYRAPQELRWRDQIHVVDRKQDGRVVYSRRRPRQ